MHQSSRSSKKIQRRVPVRKNSGRTRVLFIRVSKEEAKTIEASAVQVGLTLSAFARLAMLGRQMLV